MTSKKKPFAQLNKMARKSIKRRLGTINTQASFMKGPKRSKKAVKGNKCSKLSPF